MAALCLWCGKKLKRGTRGRPRVYCGRTCRQRAYEARRLSLEFGNRSLGDILERKRHRHLSTHDRILAMHAEREIEGQAAWHELRKLAAMKPGTRELILEMVRKEPSPRRLEELQRLVDI